ncbi:hypothetical protein J2T50_001794 [Streptococcus gallinaceus]|uniref:hypothetical protein n=1 Tax=Streptococcus gallinaceus TaxID=165758 RepID=UPI00209FB667|nr:hypothetical protein [Streptococcus gallinaceus]MCP1640071.1 hypothetical protein [Streptococcus gallinaceus]MCP1770853.1 hypothetical protein [Streptococcus gallinaceus]
MNLKKQEQSVVFDERQRGFILKSYQYGFCFMIFVLWLCFFVTRYLGASITSGFMISLAFWGGLCIQTSYAILKGAHPLVDSRFKKFGPLRKWVGIFILLYGLGMSVLGIVESVNARLGWKEFFTFGGTGMFLALDVTLTVLGLTLVYRQYLDKKEMED